ncbi:MAG TPA: helix-turn-helix transcriptional regulator [Victivallales bacterium]|nr:helix-turn-helix transcriptional regulator [Victivallales bacterium]
MNISNKKNMPNPEGSVINSDLPILTCFLHSSDEYDVISHVHKRGQVIYPNKGLAKVVCNNNYWLVPPSQAIWIPPMLEHTVSFSKSVSVYLLFVDISVAEELNPDSCVLSINKLLRELIKKTAGFGESYSVNSSEYRLVNVIIDELRILKPVSLSLPFAKDERVIRVINNIMKNPGCRDKIDYFASVACTSTRNLNRMFIKETGMSFSSWKKQFKILWAIEKLYDGMPVTNVAIELGYKSLSTFIETFKETTGKTPGCYLKLYN